jgi:hypothetical protein
MRLPLLVLAAVMILGGNVLIASVAGSIPNTVFAGRIQWACLAAVLIVAGIALVLWTNLRRAS